MVRCCQILLVLVGISHCACAAGQNGPQVAPPAAERVAFWREDINALVEGICSRHIDPFTKFTRKELEAAAASLSGRVAELPDWRVVIEMQMLAALLGDGHTSLQLGPILANIRRYPFDLAWLKDGLFIARVEAGLPELLKARLLRIGECDVEEAARRVARIAAVENRASFELAAMTRLNIAEFLQATGVIADMERADFVFRLEDGAERRVTLAPLPVGAAPEWRRAPDPQTTTMALSRKDTRPAYGQELLPGGRALYLWYDRCADTAEKTVVQWSREALDAIVEAEVERVVIDLRRNGGGNSALLWSLISGLSTIENLNRPGALVVLIGRGTYSSAQMNAAQLKESNGAVLVGYPTGQRPNSFGEVKTFSLPKSGLIVGYSTKRFQRAGPDLESLMPDVQVEATAAEFFAGRDIALETALAQYLAPKQP